MVPMKEKGKKDVHNGGFSLGGVAASTDAELLSFYKIVPTAVTWSITS